MIIRLVDRVNRDRMFGRELWPLDRTEQGEHHRFWGLRHWTEPYDRDYCPITGDWMECAICPPECDFPFRILKRQDALDLLVEAGLPIEWAEALLIADGEIEVDLAYGGED